LTCGIEPKRVLVLMLYGDFLITPAYAPKLSVGADIGLSADMATVFSSPAA
jgi:hypothetical protein